MLPAMASPTESHQPTVCEVVVGGRTSRFLVTQPDDLLQAHFVRGEFAEGPFLVDLLQYIRPGAVVLDIGANIGNHTVWFAAHAGAGQVIPFELNPAAIELLRENIALNQLDNVDLGHLGVGCGEGPGQVVVNTAYDDNLGATSFKAAAAAPDAPTFRVDSIDRMLPGRRVDFVKIDVEGMEVTALRGMPALLDRCRPVVYLEMWHLSLTSNVQFFDWLARHPYRVQRQHGPNFLCLPEADTECGQLRDAAYDEGWGFASFADDAGPQREAALAALRVYCDTGEHASLLHFAAHVLCHHGDPAGARAALDRAATPKGWTLALLQTRLAIADRLEDRTLVVDTLARLADLLPDGDHKATQLTDLIWQSDCDLAWQRDVRTVLG